MRAAVSKFGDKEFFMTVDSNFIRLNENEINAEFLHIADKVIVPRDKIALIGKVNRKVRSIYLYDGDFLEYRGTFSREGHTLALFAVNGCVPENLYESFYYLDYKQLFMLTNYGQSGTDIQANEIKILEVLE